MADWTSIKALFLKLKLFIIPNTEHRTNFSLKGDSSQSYIVLGITQFEYEFKTQTWAIARGLESSAKFNVYIIHMCECDFISSSFERTLNYINVLKNYYRIVVPCVVIFYTLIKNKTIVFSLTFQHLKIKRLKKLINLSKCTINVRPAT